MVLPAQLDLHAAVIAAGPVANRHKLQAAVRIEPVVGQNAN